MKRILMLVLAGMLFLSACGPKGTGIEVQDYWARAALKDGNGAAYMLLHNYTETDDELAGVSSDVAAASEIHLSQLSADGVMQMILIMNPKNNNKRENKKNSGNNEINHEYERW